jgi:hypothetical protein
MGLVLEKCNAQTAGLHTCMHRYNNAAHEQWRFKSSIWIVYSNSEYTVSNCIILSKGASLLTHYSDYNTSWVTGKLEFDFQQGQRFFSSLQHPDQLRPALGPIQSVQGAHFSKIKQLGNKTDHPLLPSAEVKNEWSYTSTPPYFFTAWYLSTRALYLYYSLQMCSLHGFQG